MEIDDRIREHREARRRAERRGRAAVLVALAITVGTLGVYGRLGRNESDAPILGAVLLGMAAVIIGSSVWPNRRDEWYRRHALHVAAAGLAVVVAWHLGEVLWQTFADATYRSNPGKALNMVALGTQISHVLLRERAAAGLEDDG